MTTFFIFTTSKFFHNFELIGELDTCDLPPIADLTITVPEEKCFLIGQVKSCVDSLVVVESIKGLPAIDLVIFIKFLQDCLKLSSLLYHI